MSSDGAVDVPLCDKCGKTIPESDFCQCDICGGYYHRACMRIHKHHSIQLRMPPLHEKRRSVTP